MATRDREVVGIVQGRRRRPTTLLLFSMWVDPVVRRLGLGNELVTALEHWATDWAAIETILWVYGSNRLAIRFYRELGFVVIPNGEDVEAGAKFGALAMHRDIPRR